MTGALLVSDVVEARFGGELARVAPGTQRVVVGPGGAEGDLRAVEVAFFSGDLYPERAAAFARCVVRAKGLRWLHSFSAGVDDAFFQGLLARGVRVTTSSGAHAAPIAHTVMLYLLALTRDLRGWLEAQGRRAWEPRDIRDLLGLTLGVLGLGPIGCEVARLGQAFGMRVIGVRRVPRGDEPCVTWPLTRLPELLGQADALVVALPLAEETRGLLDAEALGRLKRGALLVNVGRGGIVDEEALARRLADGSLAGAGLDVFAREPLPESSPLWSLPNVIVTPHSSGSTPGNLERSAAIFLENFEHYSKGAPLRNEARPPAGTESKESKGPSPLRGG